jgi:putative MATE family efflux protein
MSADGIEPEEARPPAGDASGIPVAAPPPLYRERPSLESRPLTAAVLDLALPAIGAGFLALAYHWVNQIWVNRLGSSAAAALSIGVFFWWALNGVGQLVVAGLSALVGRYLGAGRERPAAYVGLQGLRWAWVAAGLFGVVGFSIAGVVFDSIGASEATRAAGVPYVRVIYAGGVGWATLLACDAVFRAHGDTRTPFLLHACALVANAALDPLLIYGVGPFPALGVPGSALATVLCWAGAAAASLGILRRRGWLDGSRPSDDALRLHHDTPLSRGPFPGLDLSVGRRAVRVGAPHFAQNIFFVAMYFVLSRVVVEAGGDAAQAGLGLGLRGEQVAFVVCSGFSVAASVLVARGLGAGQAPRAERAAWRASLLAAGACGVWALVLALLDGPLASLLQIPPDAAGYARAYFRIVALSLVPQAFEIVLDGAFAGAGMTLPPMLVSMTFAAARVVLAYWAASPSGLDWGVEGVWWAISGTAAARGIVIALWFARGRWKAQHV